MLVLSSSQISLLIDSTMHGFWLFFSNCPVSVLSIKQYPEDNMHSCLNKETRTIHEQVTLWRSIDPLNNEQFMIAWVVVNNQNNHSECWQVEADSIYQDLDNSEYHKTRIHCCKELNWRNLFTLNTKRDSDFNSRLATSMYFSHFCLKIIHKSKCDRDDKSLCAGPPWTAGK